VIAIGDGGRTVTATIRHYQGRRRPGSLEVVTLGPEWVTSAQPWRKGVQSLRPTTTWTAGPLSVAWHVAVHWQAAEAWASPNCGSVAKLAAEIVELRRKNAPGPAHTHDHCDGRERVPGLLPRVESYEAQLAGAIEHVLGRYDESGGTDSTTLEPQRRG
jgi:hypothetical protein